MPRIRVRFRPAIRGLASFGFTRAAGCAFFTGVLALTSWAAEGPSAESVNPARVAALIAQLQDDRFAERQAAVEWLEALAADPAWTETVQAGLVAARSDKHLPLEMQSLLRRVAAEMPAPTKPPVELTDKELTDLLEQVGSDEFAARQAAMSVLYASLRSPVGLCRTFIAVKQRLADADIDREDEVSLLPLYTHLRQRWLDSNPAECPLPPVAPEQIQAHLDLLLMKLPENPPPELVRKVRTADRELLDMLAREDVQPAVEAAIRERLANSTDEAVQARAEKLLEWCKPALVAEIWAANMDENGQMVRRQNVAQYLFINEPWKSPNNPNNRSSHFDFCDDNRAHCKEGYTLAPGDYPVHRAFPHPDQPSQVIFHIVNLPNARRRMAFDLRLQTTYMLPSDQARRMRELSQRTCADFLNAKRELDRTTVQMLWVLDPSEVSLFAAQYFAVPTDGKPTPALTRELDSVICQLLSVQGTAAAVPGILAGLKSGRLPQVSDDVAFNTAWFAALAIALRDPWPEVDKWLAAQIEREDLLLFGQTPDAGATAAAMLLRRHGRDPALFGLVIPPLDELQLRELETVSPGFRPYRFTAPDDRRRVQTWWQTQSLQAARNEVPGLQAQR